MTIMYNKLKKFTVLTLIILHSSQQYNTCTKLSKFLNITWRSIDLNVKILENEGLIFYTKERRDKVINLTTKGYDLFKLIDFFITGLNNGKEEKKK